MNDLQLKRFHRYIRVSTKKQVKRHSYETQIRETDEFIRKNNISLVHTFTDKGEHGWNIGRPEFVNMLARLNEVDGLLVQHSDRFSRADLLDTFFIYREIFKVQNKIIYSVYQGELEHSTLEHQIKLALEVYVDARVTRDNAIKSKAGIRRYLDDGGKLGRPYKELEVDKYLYYRREFNTTKKDTAKLLKMSEATLYRRLKELGIDE